VNYRAPAATEVTATTACSPREVRVPSLRCDDWQARDFGIPVGPSSGGHLVVTPRPRNDHHYSRSVVSLFCDEGDKYTNGYFLEWQFVTASFVVKRDEGSFKREDLRLSSGQG
jgi:hypothetical protein